ncbi:hypothetical protein (plasmid) [Metabacillus dongyingensis]|nr:hypothetical protein [Metabacillus dongyingensis]
MYAENGIESRLLCLVNGLIEEGYWDILQQKKIPFFIGTFFITIFYNHTQQIIDALYFPFFDA